MLINKFELVKSTDKENFKLIFFFSVSHNKMSALIFCLYLSFFTTMFHISINGCEWKLSKLYSTFWRIHNFMYLADNGEYNFIDWHHDTKCPLVPNIICDYISRCHMEFSSIHRLALATCDKCMVLLLSDIHSQFNQWRQTVKVSDNIYITVSFIIILNKFDNCVSF